MSTSRGNCHECGKEIMLHEKIAYRIRGFEVEREGGGANSILGKERQPDRIWHVPCARRVVKYGPGQDDLGL